MNKTRSNKTVVLVFIFDHRWPEDEVVDDFFTVESSKRNNTGNSNNCNCNSKFHGLNVDAKV